MGSVPTLSDVARKAGVSLATVDRVINGRPNVKARTTERVRAAMAELDYRPDPLAAGLARRKRYRFVYLLPVGTNAFMMDLANQIGGMSNWLSSNRASAETVFADVFEPGTLARAIDEIDRAVDGAAIIALDHPEVRAAVDRLVGDGVPVVTLISDAPASRRSRFIGIDNPSAGRSAGALMGRFSGGRTGSVAVLVGSLSLRDHVDRCFGFSQAIEREFPRLKILPVRETRDDRSLAQRETVELLQANDDLVGLYNAGGGNVGVAKAICAINGHNRPVVIAHELTPRSIEALKDGSYDAVLAQNPGHEARSAARILLASANGTSVIEEQERIRIDIFIRENLPA
ncbi:transcriptional regulatory protein [Fulvimarina pelagi HTCC2506]|uniref:Transcriptional regulatory protein n=2 Tax=Fulvimarina pelagi TaxID=217511 RepID=Q0G1P6_9HYPH|nr:LacI family DNA-binding transcriptional regulator [Fulvimarina pelagi]EAU41035.1 transcriptional regulatory protein [Fulvimarina pelagi HTCC2506]BAT30949.1 transcriptional regulatory protein [Fulvimarina pelagi]